MCRAQPTHDPPAVDPHGDCAVKSALETLNPTRVKMTVEVPYEELKPSLDAAYKTIGQQIQVPGFRKGKVPARIIDQRVGRGAVLQEAVNEALPKFYGQAVDENDVRPLGQPEVDVTEVPAEEGQELKFTAEVDIRPEITLPDYAGHHRRGRRRRRERRGRRRAASPRCAQRFGTLKGVDRPAQDGDFVSIDLTATIDGEEIDTVTGVSYEVGSKNMLDGIDEALVGMTAGETKAFTAPLAGGDHEGRDADCVVTVQSVKERELPDARRRLRPAGLGVRHPRRAARRRRQAGRAGQALRAGRPGPRPHPRAAAGLGRRARARRHRRGRGPLPPRGREPARGRRAPRRGLREHPQGPEDPAPPRRDRREGGDHGRAARAHRVHRHVGAAVRHGPQRVRPGDRPAGPGARHGRRGRAPQGAGPRARAGVGRRHQRATSVDLDAIVAEGAERPRRDLGRRRGPTRTVVEPWPTHEAARGRWPRHRAGQEKAPA